MFYRLTSAFQKLFGLRTFSVGLFIICLWIIPVAQGEAPKAISLAVALYPIQVGNLYGFIDKNGKVVIEPSYDDAHPFFEGLALVTRNKRAGFINLQGEVVIKFDFEISIPFPFSEGLVAVMSPENKKWGFIGVDGKWAVNPEYDMVSMFSCGLAPVCKDNKWGYVDHGGVVRIPMQYEGAQMFGDGIGAVLIPNHNWVFINPNGDVVWTPIVSNVRRFQEGLAVAVLKGGQDGAVYIDRSGKVVLAGDYSFALEFRHGLAAVWDRNKKCGLIDRAGRFVIKPEFDEVDHLAPGLVRVKEGNEWYYINYDGKVVWRAKKEQKHNVP